MEDIIERIELRETNYYGLVSCSAGIEEVKGYGVQNSAKMILFADRGSDRVVKYVTTELKKLIKKHNLSIRYLNSSYGIVADERAVTISIGLSNGLKASNRTKDLVNELNGIKFNKKILRGLFARKMQHEIKAIPANLYTLYGRDIFEIESHQDFIALPIGVKQLFDF